MLQGLVILRAEAGEEGSLVCQVEGSGLYPIVTYRSTGVLWKFLNRKLCDELCFLGLGQGLLPYQAVGIHEVTLIVKLVSCSCNFICPFHLLNGRTSASIKHPNSTMVS